MGLSVHLFVVKMGLATCVWDINIGYYRTLLGNLECKITYGSDLRPSKMMSCCNVMFEFVKPMTAGKRRNLIICKHTVKLWLVELVHNTSLSWNTRLTSGQEWCITDFRPAFCVIMTKWTAPLTLAINSTHLLPKACLAKSHRLWSEKQLNRSQKTQK